MEAHHHVNGPHTGRNSEGRWIIKNGFLEFKSPLCNHCTLNRFGIFDKLTFFFGGGEFFLVLDQGKA